MLGAERNNKDGNILKTQGTMWNGFSLPKAGSLVGLRGVPSNATEDSRLLRLHGISAGELEDDVWVKCAAAVFSVALSK